MTDIVKVNIFQSFRTRLTVWPGSGSNRVSGSGTADVPGLVMVLGRSSESKCGTSASDIKRILEDIVYEQHW